MPSQPTSDAILDFMVETELKTGDVYDCDLLNTKIAAAIAALDDSEISSQSALGHSATVDRDAIRSNLDRLLAARNLCLVRKTASEADGATADTIALAQPTEEPIGTGFDFSGRRMM